MIDIVIISDRDSLNSFDGRSQEVPADTITMELDLSELALPRWSDQEKSNLDGPYIVILYNDDYHDMDEVATQLQKATGYDIQRCIAIMLEAHASSRAIAYSGSEQECERCATILRQIRLQVETDRA